jgi:hypothetical protein
VVIAIVRPFHAGVALLAGALVACELFLLRLFRIAHGSEFTEIAISAALLGFGASGTLLAVGGRKVRRHVRPLAIACALVTGLALLMACLVASWFTPRPGFLVWGGAEVWRLIAVTLPLCVPFLFGAAALGSVFIRWPRQTRVLYAFNLAGSGVGAVAAYSALLVLSPERALGVAAACTVAADSLMAVRAGRRTVLGLPATCLLAALLLGVLPPPALRLSDYKPLEVLMRFPGSRVVESRHHPAGRVDIVESPAFHHAPGQSLLSRPTRSPQLAVFLDGDLVGACRAGSEVPENSVAPWMIPEVLGGASTVFFGHFTDGTEFERLLPQVPGARVTLVQPHSALRDALRRRLSAPPGRVEWSATPALPLLSSMAALPADATDRVLFIRIGETGSPLSEDYLFTREGMRTLLRAAGTVVLAVAMDHPPRSSLRLVSLCCWAARDRFGRDAGQHVVVLRGHAQLAVIVSREPLSAPRDFAEAWGFDICWAADLLRSEANRFHLLDTPVFYDTAAAIFAGRGEALLADYPFDIRPAQTWRPFHWQPFDAATLWAIVVGRRVPGLETVPEANALLALAVKIRIVAVAAVMLLLIPLALRAVWGRRRCASIKSNENVILGSVGTVALSAVGYFVALGFGYLTVEMFALFLVRRVVGEPVLAAAVTVGGFLIASGVGSMTVRPGRLLFPAIVLFVMVMAGAMEIVHRYAGTMPVWARFAICLACVMPPAYLMGAPFPAGLGAVGRHAGHLVPWVWGVNGFASVLAAPLALLVALTAGYGAVAGVGIMCYLLAALAGRRIVAISSTAATNPRPAA